MDLKLVTPKRAPNYEHSTPLSYIIRTKFYELGVKNVKFVKVKNDVTMARERKLKD